MIWDIALTLACAGCLLLVLFLIGGAWYSRDRSQD